MASFNREVFDTPCSSASFSNCCFKLLSIQPVKRWCVFSKACVPRFLTGWKGLTREGSCGSSGYGDVSEAGLGRWSSPSLERVSGLIKVFLQPVPHEPAPQVAVLNGTFGSARGGD
jgi:hypothetical protein